MITETLKFSQWKNYSQLQIGDILQLKKDKFFYEIKNIVAIDERNPNRMNSEFYFYGFNVMLAKNLYKYFENEHGELKVYKR